MCLDRRSSLMSRSTPSVRVQPASVPARIARRIWGDRPLTRTLGFYQCYGGVLGVAALLDVAPRLMLQAPTDARPSGLVLWAVVAVLMASLALSGVLFLRGHRFGIAATVGVQLAQLLYFSVGPASYLFFGGFYLGVAFELGAITVTPGWQVYAELGAAVGRTFLGVNLVPLVILVLLKRSTARSNDAGARPFGFSIAKPGRSAPGSAHSSE